MTRPRHALALAAATIALGAALAHAAPPAPDGAALFRKECGGCHLEQGFGTRQLARRVGPEQALLEKRTDLQADYVAAAVRHGIGAMPMIRAAELDDARLAAIGRYLAREKTR